jgi:hypothetical protein
VQAVGDRPEAAVAPRLFAVLQQTVLSVFQRDRGLLQLLFLD